MSRKVEEIKTRTVRHVTMLAPGPRARILDQIPTFVLGCADTYDNADEGWALKPVAPFKGNASFSWHRKS